MKRVLSFVADDEAGTSHIEGVDKFTLFEILGIAEEIRLWAAGAVINNRVAADKAAAEAAAKPKRRRRKTGGKK